MGSRFFRVVAKALGMPWLQIKSGALKRGAHTSNFMDLTIQPALRVGLLRALVTPNSPHLIAAVEFVSRTGGAMPLAYWNTAKTVFWIVIRGWSADRLLEKDDELAPALLAARSPS